MTPLPKRRHSTRRGGKRKAAIKLVVHTKGKCPNCGAPIASHRACPTCGMYKGTVSKKIRKVKVESKKK